MRRALRIIAIVLLSIVLVLTIGFLFLLRSSFTREKLRDIMQTRLASMIDGSVSIGEVRGGLLGDLTIINFTISDTSGTEFVAFDTLSAKYALLPLLRGRYVFYDVRLVRPRVFLDQKTGERWNYARIFRLGLDSAQADTAPNRMLLRLERVQIVDGDVRLRIPWQPDPALRGSDRQKAIDAALSEDFLFRIERAGDSYQMVHHYASVYARLPSARLRDPAAATMVIDIDSLASIADVVGREELAVRRGKGEVTIANDSILLRRMDIQLPRSSFTGDGSLELATGSVYGRFHADSLWGTDIGHIDSRIPENLRATFDLVLSLQRQRSHYELSNLDVQAGPAHARGVLDIAIAPTRLSDAEFGADLQISTVGTGLLRQIAPALVIPAKGTFTGSFAGSGALSDLTIESDLIFTDSLTGPSHFIATGGLSLVNQVVLKDLSVRLEPARASILRNGVPDFPLEGDVRGTALLRGTVGDSISSTLDLQLMEEGRESRVTGRADFWSRRGEPQTFSLDLKAEVLDLATVREFLPDSSPDLRGAASGSMVALGPLSAFKVGIDLAIRGGGSVVADGVLDVASDTIGYDLTITTERFNASSVLYTSEVTSINGSAGLRGQGTDPASLNAAIDLLLRPSSFRDIELDSARAGGQLSNGVMRFDTLGVWLSGAVARADGTLGVTDSTTGTLAFRIQVDSLATLRRWIPGDTTIVQPRPGRITEAYRIARADSARIARETEMQRLLTGAPPPALNVKLPAAIPADSVAGSATAEGTLTGNVNRMSAKADLTATNVVAAGMSARLIEGTTSLVILPPDSLSGSVEMHLTNASAAGYAIDSIAASGTWNGRHGNVDVAVSEGADRRFHVVADVERSTASTVVDLKSAEFQFDSLITWRTRQPARVSFSPTVIAIDSLALDAGSGSIRVDGKLSENPGDSIRIGIFNTEIFHLLRVSQSDINMTGLFSGFATLTGGLDAPVFHGAAGYVNGTISGNPLPELHAVFDYDGSIMKTDIIANREMGEPFASGNAEFGLSLGRAPRVTPGPKPVTAHFRLDGLPLELVPDVTANLSQLTGSLLGELRVSGTMDDPVVRGNVSIASGGARVNSLGIHLDDIEARVNIDGDTLIIDNFTARSGGPVTLTGGLGLAKLSEPSFDLHLMASNAYVLYNERGRLRATSVDVAMDGPYLATSIRGWIELRNGVVYIPDYTEKVVVAPWDSLFLFVVDTGDVRTRDLYVPPNPFMENLEVRIQLNVPRDTWVRSPDANIELFSEGPLQINLARPSRRLSLEGTLSTDRGVYTFLSKRFEIKRGTATFFANQPEINPTVQITGDHEVQLPASNTVTISVVLGGTMLRPKVALESDAQPPLSQSDMLSYLAAGRSSGSLLSLGISGLAPGAGISGVGKLAGQSLIGVALGTLMAEVEREAEGAGMRSLGLDLLNITPAETYTEIAKGDVFSFLRQTEFEVGRYVSTKTFVAGNLRLSATPGVRGVHRTPKGFRFEAAWEPKLLLREPTLADQQRSITKRAFSLFIWREWRF